MRQHRLIYLCERDVVRPDYGNARGRDRTIRELHRLQALRMGTLVPPVFTADITINDDR